MNSRLCRWLAILALCSASWAHAAGTAAPFDLTGPSLEVTVTRGGATLPIAQAPHLATGDKLWIKADFPETQSEHYLLILAFLRGPTNPPPKNWFFKCEAWKKACQQKGLTVTVPEGAQQALIFLAPEDGGDFKTLSNAVRGRPGAFVRATQELNQATLDRSRLERYLASIRHLNAANPAVLKDTTPLLARSLGIKADEKCLDRLPQLQAPCLMQGQETLILNDGHSVSIVESLTTGPASDLVMAASHTPQANYGYYSPYLSSLFDLGRLFDSFRVANYQYIPALATALGTKLTLTLNTPPSFQNPKSVLVAALPAVEQALPPPLHAVSPKDIYCARRDSLVLPVEGAPLVFATEYAHNTVLRVAGKDGETIDLPATADATQGGFVVDTSPLATASLSERFKGSLHGYWGFDKFDGPGFQLVNTHSQSWSPSSLDDGSLIIGRANTIHLQAGSVACIDRIMVKDPSGKELRVDWSPVKANEVEINLPLQQAEPGAVTLLVSQFGSSEPHPVELRAYPEAGRFESFAIHAGESHGVLKGSRLSDVASLSLKGLDFVPTPSATDTKSDALRMEVVRPVEPESTTADAAPEQPAPSLQQGDTVKAKVKLRDGRSYTVNVTVAAPRPSVELVGKSVQLSTRSNESNIQLASEDQLPQDAQLIFSVKAKSPAIFSREANIEVASKDEGFATTLSLANRGITLVDSKVAVVTFDPAKAFGFSAFGPLKYRIVNQGVAGDWQSLVTLVRLPVLQALQCPAVAEQACKLTGSNLFLVDSVSSDSEFKKAIAVPAGFPGRALPVPRPGKSGLYVRLRDDPSVINVAALTAEELPPPPGTEPAPAPAAPTPAPVDQAAATAPAAIAF
ncbi:hypothetical protein [Steroidobacter sp.]|uniref:hypothetical protein n=1 Tax=Steroidobacter sp. TaxID=1978227 RepID=UPI001A470F0E|nr:hypothetical protein [Steroidobacter sp.]MBL8271030.1 hypothetical protein [Steroidobacter sp.]